MNYDKLIRNKIYAYLHDPFHKPYVITNTLKLKGKDYCKGLKAHENEAIWILKELFGEPENPCKVLEGVKDYDKMASVLDRVLIPKGYSDIQRANMEFLNPFNPEITFPVQYMVSDKEKVKQFYDKLKEVLKSCNVKKDPIKCYHLLYATAEPLWYKVVGKPPIADTRVPTHTVFDHNSATATMLNVFDGSGFKGYLVEFDIPGIQSFVSSGRGPGDLWARSWLLSALAWYVVKEFVEKLGPDILITPSARYNPFYISTVYAMLNGNERKTFEQVFDGIKVNLLDVSQPVIPATIRMYLPKGVCKFLGKVAENEEECIRGILIERFNDGWKKVVETSLKALDEVVLPKGIKIFLDKRYGYDTFLIANEDDDQTRKLMKEGKLEEIDLEDLKNKMKDILNKVSAPFRATVTVLDLAEAFDEFNKTWKDVAKSIENEVNEKFANVEFEYVKKDELVNKNLKYWSFLYWLFTVRFRKEKDLVSSIRVNPKITDGWTFNTFKEAYESAEDPVKLCPCGSPAIMSNWTSEPVLHLRGREALCPFCYVMRLLQHNVGEAVRKLFGPLPRVPKAPKISTATLAALPELAELMAKKGEGEDEIKFLNEYSELKSYEFESLVEALKKSLPMPRIFKNKIAIPFDLQRLLDAIRNGEEAFFSIEVEGEKAYLSISEISNVKDKLENLNKYIALVRGDGDGMGDIASGRLGLSVRDYFKKIYRYLDENKREKIAEGISSIISTFVKAVLPRELGGEVRVPTTLPTPSYTAQFSYAQMISALLDAKIVEANFGVLIFAGGDDVVAIFPVRSKVKRDLAKYVRDRLNLKWLRLLEPYISPALEGWWLTRLNYWGLRRGFHYDDGIFSPALVAYGRKYGIAIRHYRDPLSLVYAEANELEENAKKLKRIFMDRELEKDGTTVSYGRAIGKGVGGIAVPNTTFARTLEELYCSEGLCCNCLAPMVNWLLAKIHEGTISRNFFYDLMDNYEELEGLEGVDKEVFSNLLIFTAMSNSSYEHVKDDFSKLAEKLEDEVCKICYNEHHLNPFSTFVKFVMEWYKAVR